MSEKQSEPLDPTAEAKRIGETDALIAKHCPHVKRTKHTPGPWAIIFGGMGEDEHFTIGAKRDDVLVAECANSRAPGEQVRANAALIAAAPDLLAALRGVLPHIEHEADNGGGWDELVKTLSAAIAAAEGSK
jgi:hypothetical protein